MPSYPYLSEEYGATVIQLDCYGYSDKNGEAAIRNKMERKKSSVPLIFNAT
jgi:hypothetical protein